MRVSGSERHGSADLSAIVIGAFFVVHALLGSVNNPHNFVHLASGFVLVVAAYLGEAAGAITGLGLVYLLLSFAGLVLHEAVLDYLALNAGGNLLDAAFGAVLLTVGLVTKAQARAESP